MYEIAKTILTPPFPQHGYKVRVFDFPVLVSPHDTMITPTPLVIFGPGPESYLVCYGRRYTAKNMPSSLIENLASGVLPTMAIGWISINHKGTGWAASNSASDTILWDSSIHPSVIDHLSGGNNKAKSSFASFCDDPEGWFVKHAARGGWDMAFADNYPHKIGDLRRQIADFDQGLRAIIFGQGGTHVYVLEAGFVAELNGDAERAGHPLYQAFVEQGKMGPGWTLDLGSTLCFWDARYFCLRFQKGDQIQWRMSVPDNIQAVLDDLVKVCATPEEQAALGREDAQIRAIRQASLQAKMAMIQNL